MNLYLIPAFVSGGIILETPFKIGETLNGKNDLNIREEKNATQERLEQLTVEKADEEVVSSAMNKVLCRHNYMDGQIHMCSPRLLLEGLRKDVSLVIVRPTIISSTYKEPFPGWIEGIKTIDSFIVAYGRGRISCFLGDPVKVLDIVISMVQTSENYVDNTFFFDPKSLNWEDYFTNIHIPGLVKYAIKQ
ncbi:Fatty acyl-CoA reductase [Cynara cardunculus var. scolymus]|uniref:Fatty acyl-CoA reductase n=1 Tax=Cynara cardunculus var. scolymus TaxID=59895 RepID=A0A124SFT5_CYNCS|nr:Fatty acyl-CoA reductase [Cynara cardunculus var. scolymus]